VDPIHPIAPGPRPLSRAERAPVQRLERISRERDRPSKDQREGKRRQPPRESAAEPGEDDEERPHIDVRA
jgi:hypothetical protein